MSDIAGRRPDPEAGHIEADDLMMQALSEIGYSAGVAIYSSIPKWYA